MLDAYAEQAEWIGADPERDRQAKIQAVERAGYTHLTKDESKLKAFMALWKSDESRLYLVQHWALEISEDPDPVSLVMRLLHTHAVQTDESWGERSRSESLAAVREMAKLFIPAQTAKVAPMNLSAKIERPADYDQ